jgi:hypothetical protein
MQENWPYANFERLIHDPVFYFEEKNKRKTSQFGFEIT